MAQEDRLPALNALRAFEAAARHLSFTRAAEELNVTPGAISQQIRQLEEFAGAPLFRRTGRQVRANISLDRGMLEAIDRAASERNLTRSAFLADAARNEIEHRRL